MFRSWKHLKLFFLISLSVNVFWFAVLEAKVVDPELVSLESSRFITWTKDGVEGRKNSFSINLNGKGWSEPREISYEIMLRFGSFDPLRDKEILKSFVNHPVWFNVEAVDTLERLHIVQFKTPGMEKYREGIRELGGEVLHYLPNNSHIVRMDVETSKKIADLPFVRWVGDFYFGFKLEEKLQFRSETEGRQRYLIVVSSKFEKEKIIEIVEGLGGEVLNSAFESSLMEVELNREELMKLAQFPEVMWIEKSTEIEEDMNNARIQGGAEYIQSQVEVPGYTGIGIRGHIMEGIFPEHPDLAANEFREAPIAVSDPTSSYHGQSTFGIIFASGEGSSVARGVLPNGQGLFTNFDYLYDSPAGSHEEPSRYELVGRLVNEHRVMFQTASWGHEIARVYTARSWEMDEIIFDHDIPITQSQSNLGTQDSRPQAWAKNIISVGGVFHFNNDDPSDDVWDGGASIGPASDGRIKPDVVAFYDQILTLSSSEYTVFSGTSGATPIVAGYVGLILEMWTNGIFGNELKNQEGDRFDNRPHFTTTKALLINSARQYEFSSTTHDLARFHQGWGFPAVDRLYDLREKILVVNEDHVVENREKIKYEVNVSPDTPMLKVTLVYADPPPTPVASVALVNNLDLKVIDPEGTEYWGNFGTKQYMYSDPWGDPDTVDTVENVFIKNPLEGTWKVEVIGDRIEMDAHIETEEVDADFALVVSGVVKE
ncbi:S8 family serine peptidase [Bdellovibrionota bacterium]